MSKSRSSAMTVMALLAILAALLALVHALQMFRLLPLTLGGTFMFFTQGLNIVGGILWLATAALDLWLASRLWSAHPQSSRTLPILAIAGLVVAALSWLGGSPRMPLFPIAALNAILLGYGVMPGAKR